MQLICSFYSELLKSNYKILSRAKRTIRKDSQLFHSSPITKNYSGITLNESEFARRSSLGKFLIHLYGREGVD